MARKTIEVGPLAKRIQRGIQLAESDGERQALCRIMEDILMQTGNYHGFGFRDENWEWTVNGIYHDGEPNYWRRHYYTDHKFDWRASRNQYDQRA